jgi:hypothetical protein
MLPKREREALALKGFPAGILNLYTKEIYYFEN